MDDPGRLNVGPWTHYRGRLDGAEVPGFEISFAQKGLLRGATGDVRRQCAKACAPELESGHAAPCLAWLQQKTCRA